MKILLQIQFFLLLLLTLLGKGQQVTASDDQPPCNDFQYWNESFGICCSRCAPGTYMKKECNATFDTQCQPCEEGKFAANWNYAKTCRRCQGCPSHLIEKEKCSSIKKEVCVCPTGYNCTQYNGLGVCMICTLIRQATIPPPTFGPSITPTAVQTVRSYWFIATICAVSVIMVMFVLTMLYVHRNKSILEKLGCMGKVKKPLPETHGSGGIAPTSVTRVLLIPDNPPYPIQETDASQSAEVALNSKPRQPI